MKKLLFVALIFLADGGRHGPNAASPALHKATPARMDPGGEHGFGPVTHARGLLSMDGRRALRQRAGSGDRDPSQRRQLAARALFRRGLGEFARRRLLDQSTL